MTVAKYEERYLSYLNNTHSPSDDDDGSFLTVHQFVPWDTLKESHIRELGPILLTIGLKADADSKVDTLVDGTTHPILSAIFYVLMLCSYSSDMWESVI